jgi:hypothetical protein
MAKAILVMSLDKEQVAGLKDRVQAARDMATRVRGERGVRQVEAINFRQWRGERADFEPVGAVAFVEAPDETVLQDRVNAVWRAAGTRGLEMRAVDDW